MSGRRKATPEPGPCRLCGPLAQATIHFDAGYWAGVKQSAERALAEVKAEIADAEKHLRMLGERK